MDRRESRAGRITAIARSPLVHFLIIGAAIYAAGALFTPPAAEDEGSTIRISAGDMQWMEDSWVQRWNRLPTPIERQALILS